MDKYFLYFVMTCAGMLMITATGATIAGFIWFIRDLYKD